ncbi:MAG TPA: sugar phosphate isomerase/epimerase [Abditibacteriaceae bacterium]|jgi:sugar phosphate isomerase/epimerase
MNWIVSAFADEAGGDCAQQIKSLQRADLKHIDIRGIEGHNITTLPLDTAREIKKQLEDGGIAVNMFGSPIGKIDINDDLQGDIDRLRHLGELAPVLDCRAVRIFSFYNKAERPHIEWHAKSLSRLETLLDEAEKLGLVLFHENERHIFGDLCEDVLHIAPLRGDNFKLIFDFDNYNQSGENAWENWQRLADVTDAIHLKDSVNGQHTPVGLGGGYVREILIDAIARGWSGPLSIEPHLSHSGAVAATGPSGVANEQFAKLPAPESFHVAAETAMNLLREIGAPVA